MKELKRSNHVHKIWKRKCSTLNNFGMPYLWGLKIGLIAEISHTYHTLARHSQGASFCYHSEDY